MENNNKERFIHIHDPALPHSHTCDCPHDVVEEEDINCPMRRLKYCADCGILTARILPHDCSWDLQKPDQVAVEQDTNRWACLKCGIGVHCRKGLNPNEYLNGLPWFIRRTEGIGFFRGGFEN